MTNPFNRTMYSYVSFEKGVVPNATELVGDNVVIDLREKELSLVPSDGGERIAIPIAALKRVELVDEPEIIDHG